MLLGIHQDQKVLKKETKIQHIIITCTRNVVVSKISECCETLYFFAQQNL